MKKVDICKHPGFFFGFWGLILILCPIAVSHAEEPLDWRDKVKVQNTTAQALDALDQLSLEANAIFTDQSEENIGKYILYYKKAIDIIDRLEEVQRCWKKLIEQNNNDKIYRVYMATVQLGLYSIYSRGNEFLIFLKFADDKMLSKYMNEKLISKEILSAGYTLKKDEWQQNATSFLVRAQESISRALKIDENYLDARVLESQWLVLKGDYEEALKKFNLFAKEGWLRDQRSFLNSWKAYVELKRGILTVNAPLNKETEGYLTKASAFSEPAVNSEWASRYMQKFRLINVEEIIFTSPICHPVENVKLEQLKKNMNKQISTINDLLNKTLIPIPKPILKGTKISDLTSKKNVFLTLGTDTSDGNLNLYAGLITSIYETAKDLEKSKRDWNLLASQNEKVNYYYLINKSLCSLAIIEAVQLSKDIVDNKKMKDFLLRYQKVKKRENKEIIDYESQWQEWLKSLAAELDNDINTLTTNNPNFLPAKLLSFEYAAILKSPHQAMAQLEKLEKTVSSYHLRTFDRNEKIDIRTYVAAWKSYLSLKMSDLDSAEKYLSKAKGFLGLNKWKRDQEKRLYVTEKLSQQEYLK